MDEVDRQLLAQIRSDSLKMYWAGLDGVYRVRRIDENTCLLDGTATVVVCKIPHAQYVEVRTTPYRDDDSKGVLRFYSHVIDAMPTGSEHHVTPDWGRVLAEIKALQRGEATPATPPASAAWPPDYSGVSLTPCTRRAIAHSSPTRWLGYDASVMADLIETRPDGLSYYRVRGKQTEFCTRAAHKAVYAHLVTLPSIEFDAAVLVSRATSLTVAEKVEMVEQRCEIDWPRITRDFDRMVAERKVRPSGESIYKPALDLATFSAAPTWRVVGETGAGKTVLKLTGPSPSAAELDVAISTRATPTYDRWDNTAPYRWRPLAAEEGVRPTDLMEMATGEWVPVSWLEEPLVVDGAPTAFREDWVAGAACFRRLCRPAAGVHRRLDVGETLQLGDGIPRCDPWLWTFAVMGTKPTEATQLVDVEKTYAMLSNLPTHERKYLRTLGRMVLCGLTVKKLTGNELGAWLQQIRTAGELAFPSLTVEDGAGFGRAWIHAPVALRVGWLTLVRAMIGEKVPQGMEDRFVRPCYGDKSFAVAPWTCTDPQERHRVRLAELGIEGAPGASSVANVAQAATPVVAEVGFEDQWGTEFER